jgi:hypothetical protein
MPRNLVLTPMRVARLVPISFPRSVPRRAGRTTIHPILCRNFVLTRFADLIRPAVAPKGQHDNSLSEDSNALFDAEDDGE